MSLSTHLRPRHMKNLGSLQYVACKSMHPKYILCYVLSPMPRKNFMFPLVIFKQSNVLLCVSSGPQIPSIAFIFLRCRQPVQSLPHRFHLPPQAHAVLTLAGTSDFLTWPPLLPSYSLPPPDVSTTAYTRCKLMVSCLAFEIIIIIKPTHTSQRGY